MLKITFLGTGTSHGIPVIACSCKTCTSSNSKNQRYRTSVHIQTENTSIVIDTPPEFRLRAVEYKINRIDALLFTHAHFDHSAGLDDIRRYNDLQKMHIPVYGNDLVMKDYRRRFYYIFEESQEGGGKPKLELHKIEDYQTFQVHELDILAIPVLHGNIKVFGYRIKDFAFITDVSHIPQESYRYLEGLDTLVLDALRPTPHPTHFSLDQAIAVAQIICPKTTYFTHISHGLEHDETEKILPSNMFLAYDGLKLNFV